MHKPKPRQTCPGKHRHNRELTLMLPTLHKGLCKYVPKAWSLDDRWQISNSPHTAVSMAGGLQGPAGMAAATTAGSHGSMQAVVTRPKHTAWQDSPSLPSSLHCLQGSTACTKVRPSLTGLVDAWATWMAVGGRTGPAGRLLAAAGAHGEPEGVHGATGAE